VRVSASDVAGGRFTRLDVTFLEKRGKHPIERLHLSGASGSPNWAR
jgi:hypothetical protein